MALHLLLFLYVSLSLSFTCKPTFCQNTEQNILMAIKSSLDPQNTVLHSWIEGTDHCDGSFEGLACNGGRVVNISLQGKGLVGTIPSAIGGLKRLSGLYLHFNSLTGGIPKEIANLPELSDLYLNVNDLSGGIPPEIGNMSNLQVLELCCNKLNGSIPMQIGSLNKLNVLALQSNQLTGAMPASLGDLQMLKRLDLSFNRLFGSIPIKLANVSSLEVVDIHNNELSGHVPQAFKRLNKGFVFANNFGLCGDGFSSLKSCNTSGDQNVSKPRPRPFGPGAFLKKDIPEPAVLQTNGSKIHTSRHLNSGAVFILIGATVTVSFVGLSTFLVYQHKKQKIKSVCDNSDSRLSTDHVREIRTKSASPLISLEYSNGWDPLGHSANDFSQGVLESFVFNVEDVEFATQYFSGVNLLERSNFSSVYKGILRDGSSVAIKCIAKTSSKSDEAEFLKGLKILTSLKHENLVKLRGFCCSKDRGECFLIYNSVPNGNLLEYLDVEAGSEKVLDWPTRVSIINGIAKGICYLHTRKGNKPALVHQNISAEKVLLDQQYNPLLSDSGLHKLLADDIVFSTVKTSAAMGYLAPEYSTTGRFTEKSDVYAFGMVLFQILSGKEKITELTRQEADLCKSEDFVDPNLEGKFSETEAYKLGKIALLCVHESPSRRPTMENVLEELCDVSGSSS